MSCSQPDWLQARPLAPEPCQVRRKWRELLENSAFSYAISSHPLSPGNRVSNERHVRLAHHHAVLYEAAIVSANEPIICRSEAEKLPVLHLWTLKRSKPVSAMASHWKAVVLSPVLSTPEFRGRVRTLRW